MLAQVAGGALPVDIPWGSLASSGTMVVAMAVALKYTAERQRVNEAALKEAHERHIASLGNLLKEEKERNDKDRVRIDTALECIGDILEAVQKKRLAED